MKITISFCLLTLTSGSWAAEPSCYSSKHNPYSYFSTKTSYFYAHPNENYNNIPSECTLKKIWLLCRHGTRNAKKIEEMKNFGNKYRDIIVSNAQRFGLLCEEDIQAFNSWTYNLTNQDQLMLTQSGYDELVKLGTIYKDSFPELLNLPYDPSNIKIYRTSKVRTEESAKAFMQGMLPNTQFIIEPVPKEETLLRYIDYCDKWKIEVQDNLTTFREQNLFNIHDWSMQCLILNVSRHLGLRTLLSMEEISILYDLCRYEKTRFPYMPSIWCSGFSESDLKTLEYSNDLNYWYRYGYYKKLNGQMPCLLLKELALFFRSEKVSASLYFAHSRTLLPFLTLLGLYQDSQPLTHSNYESLKDSRLYQTSKIGSFSNNVAFLFLECSGEYKIQVMHQGQVVHLPSCSSKLCDWNEFLQKYQEALNCSFDELCERNLTRSKELF